MDDGSSGVAVSLSLCLVRLVFLERGGDVALGILFGGLFLLFHFEVNCEFTWKKNLPATNRKK
jgi:hypothetical protein